jgi:O-glycosyl hydrolase
MLYQRTILGLALALTLISGCSLSLNPSQGNMNQPTPIPVIADKAAVSVDGAQRFQKIDGFGVNINGASWDNGKIVPVLDTLSTDLGSTIFRVMIETPQWEATNDNNDPKTFNWDYYRPIYNGPYFSSLWNIIRHLEQKPGAQVILNVMGPMPAWMGDKKIDQSSEDEWVEMIVSLLVYARQEQGIQIHLLSPLNEIDMGHPEAPRVDGDQYARLLHLLVVRLDELGLGDTMLVSPEIAYAKSVERYLPALLSDDLIMTHLAHFAIHDYSGQIKDTRDLIAASNFPSRNVWVTEYSAWCNDCNKTAQRAEQWSFASDTTQYLFTYLQTGAAAGLLYDGFDGSYAHHGQGTFDYWGVVAYNPQTGAFAPRPRFYASAQVFKFVRPGMVRIATTSVGGLPLLAFVDPDSGALTIVGCNPSDHAVTLDMALSNLAPSTSFHVYQSTEGKYLVPGPDSSVSDGKLQVSVLANSIFTLTTLR